MRCMAAERCRAADEHGNPADDRLPLCFWCLEAAERDVRALVLDYRDLEQLLPPSLGQRGDGMPKPRGDERPLPFSEHIFDLQHEIWFVTDAWDAVVRDFDRLSEKPPRTRAGWSVQQSVSILAPRLDRLAQTSGTMWDYPGSTDRCSEVPGWQGVLDLARLHHRARGALGLSAARPELCQGVPCRACGLKALYRQDEGAVRCDGCGQRYDVAEYSAWVSELAAQAPKIVIPAA